MPLYLPSGGGGGGADLPFADLDQAVTGQTVLYDGSAFRPADLPDAGLGPGVSTAYSQAVLGFVPTAYYRMGEDSGLMADSSGNAHHGVFDGTSAVAGLVASDANGAQSFGGADVAIVDHAAWQDDVATLTILATIKPSDVSVVRSIVARYDGWAAQTFAASSYSFRVDADGKLAFHAFYSGNNEWGLVTGPGVIGADDTHDVAVTVNGTHVILCVDGAPVAQGDVPGAINVTAMPLSIGAHSVNHGEPMIGVIDEVVLYDHVLGSVDLMSLHLTRAGGE